LRTYFRRIANGGIGRGAVIAEDPHDRPLVAYCVEKLEIYRGPISCQMRR